MSARSVARLALCCVLAGSAWAAPAHHTAQEQLAEGQRLYLRADFSAALRSLDAAATSSPEPAVLAQIQLERGLCFAALKDVRSLDDAFTAALAADPDARLDPAQVLPAVVDRLEAIRLGLKGTLSVAVTPAEATVELDGQPVGAGTFRAEVPIGTHEVLARGVDGNVTRQRVRVLAQRTAQVTLSVSARDIAPAHVESTPTPPLPSAQASPRVQRTIDFGLDARGYLADFSTFGAELDVAVAGKYWIVEGGVLAGAFPAFNLRAGVRSGMWARHLRGYLAAEGVAFLGQGVNRFGPGLSAGLGVRIIEPVEPFLEVSLFRLSGRAQPPTWDFVLSLGVRLWLP